MSEFPPSNSSEQEPTWEERWERFKSFMSNAAREESEGISGTSHFSRSVPDFEVLGEEEKKWSVEIWEKLQDGTITYAELGEYRGKMGEIIGGISKSRNLALTEQFDLVQHMVSSYLVNKGTVIVARARMNQ